MSISFYKTADILDQLTSIGALLFFDSFYIKKLNAGVPWLVTKLWKETLAGQKEAF